MLITSYSTRNKLIFFMVEFMDSRLFRFVIIAIALAHVLIGSVGRAFM